MTTNPFLALSPTTSVDVTLDAGQVRQTLGLAVHSLYSAMNGREWAHGAWRAYTFSLAVMFGFQADRIESMVAEFIDYVSEHDEGVNFMEYAAYLQRLAVDWHNARRPSERESVTRKGYPVR